MEALDAHRSFITLTLTKMAFCPAVSTTNLSLKVCAVVVLTGLAELLALFANDQLELRRKKHDAILEIISISTTFSEEDCQFLDPILSVSRSLRGDVLYYMADLTGWDVGVLDGDHWDGGSVYQYGAGGRRTEHARSPCYGGCHSAAESDPAARATVCAGGLVRLCGVVDPVAPLRNNHYPRRGNVKS